MLLPAQVLPFLNHEDADVRRHAAYYCNHLSDSAPPQAADEIWRALNHFSDEVGEFDLREGAALWYALREVPQTDASVTQAIERLRTPDLADDHRKTLCEVLENVQLDLLDRRREEILNAVDLETRSNLEHRLALRSVGVDQLWDQLVAEALVAGEESFEDDDIDEDADAYDDLDDDDEPDFRRAERLIEALAAYPEVVAARAMAVLEDPEDSWLEIWCVDLLGQIRHAPAIDLIIEKLVWDEGDYLGESAGQALRRMHPVSVVPKLVDAEVFDSEDGSMRMGEILGQIKHPLAETALIQLLGDESDLEVVTVLAYGLVSLCTTEGLDALRDVVAQNEYVAWHADLKEELVTLAKMVGYEPPELAAWRSEVADPGYQEKQRAANRQAMQEYYDRKSAESFDDEPIFEPLPALSESPPALYEEPQEVTMPIRRESPKVGRNDPCPCGSGKKYKKCCGK